MPQHTSPPAPDSVSPRHPGAALSYLVPLLVLVLVCLVRLRLLGVPLERDEGEFAYLAQLLLKGAPPFSQAYSMKLPGVSFLYAPFVALFGATPAAVHLGLLAVTAANVALIFLLGRRLLERPAALLAAACYALMSLSRAVYGAHAHATHFALLFILAGLLLMLRALERDSRPLLLAGGLCFGLAFTMKQHAVLLLLFALIYLALNRAGRAGAAARLGSLALFLAGAALPYLALLLWAAGAGTLEQFWFWTVQYPRSYVAQQGMAQGAANFGRSFGGILLLQLPFWLLAGAGALLLRLRRARCSDPGFLYGFALFSLLSVCPGLYFREHYFVLLLPAAALLAGAALSAAARPAGAGPAPLRGLLPSLLLVAALGYALVQEQEYLFKLTPLQVSRLTYDENPFPESLQVARYLKEHSAPGERIAVLGSEPQLYFYADRLSATGHIYMYGLMERHQGAERMQLEMIREIEAARPGYIVVVNVAKSWLKGAHSIDLISPWRERYLQGYRLVGVTDIVGSTETRYLWEGEALGYTPVSRAYLTIYRRKDGA